MQIEVTAYGEIDQEGNLSLLNRHIFIEESRINFRGKKVKFVLTEDFEPVKDGLRKYYFAIMLGHLVDAFKKNGMTFTKKEVDEKMRRMFLVKEVVDESSGEITSEPKTLKKDACEVSNDEMREYIRLIIAFSAEHLEYGIPYPLEY